MSLPPDFRTHPAAALRNGAAWSLHNSVAQVLLVGHQRDRNQATARNTKRKAKAISTAIQRSSQCKPLIRTRANARALSWRFAVSGSTATGGVMARISANASRAD
jgi:hypothetical protein